MVGVGGWGGGGVGKVTIRALCSLRSANVWIMTYLTGNIISSVSALFWSFLGGREEGGGGGGEGEGVKDGSRWHSGLN